MLLGGDASDGVRQMNGKEVIIGTALMLAGENKPYRRQGVAERLEEVKKSMPPGFRDPALRSVRAVDATIGRSRKTCRGRDPGHRRIVLAAPEISARDHRPLCYPLVVLMMAIGMNRYGVSGNLMISVALWTLPNRGRVDLIIENCLGPCRTPHHEGRCSICPNGFHELFDASKEMVKPTVYGQAIILLVFVPCSRSAGVEARCLRRWQSPSSSPYQRLHPVATFVPALIAV